MASEYSMESNVTSDSCEMNDYLSNLPDELKLRILHLVDSQTIRQSVALVNRHFNHLTTDYSLYKQYETADFDLDGHKTLTELNHPLYQTHLQFLSTTSFCLNRLEFRLQKFKKLQKIVVRTVNCHMLLNFLCQLRNVRIIVSDKLIPIQFDVRMLSLQIELEDLPIGRKEDLENMRSIAAGRYLINVGIMSSAEVLRSFLMGDLAYLLQMDNIRFESDSVWSIFSGDLLPHIILSKVVSLEIRLDCSIAEHVDAVKAVCEHCSCLEYLDLLIINIDRFPVIEKVESKQLETVVFEAEGDWESRLLIERVGLLLRAARLTVDMIAIKPLPLGLLRCLSPTLLSLKLFDCGWCEDGESFNEQTMLKSLALINTSPAPILQCIHPSITKLELCAFNIKREALESLSFLEEFSITDSLDCISINLLLEALLSSKDTLRVFRFRGKTVRDTRYTLQLLCQFRQLRFFKIRGRVSLTRKEVEDHFPTAILHCVTEGGDTYENSVYL